MTNLKQLFFGFASMALLAGCSNDIEQPATGTDPGSEDNTPSVYLGVSFQMQAGGNGTRSFTNGDNSSNDGTEVGTDIENNVNEVLLIIADTQNKFIAATTVTQTSLSVHTGDPYTSKTYHAAAQMNRTDINSAYDNDKDFDGNVNVFVIANPNDAIIDAVNKAAQEDKKTAEWVNTVGSVTVVGQTTNGSIWSSSQGGQFLMSNIRIEQRKFPAEKKDWDAYTKQTNPFHLSANNTGTSLDNSKNEDGIGGAIKIERVAARFDYKDGSTLGTDKPRMYNVVFERDAHGNIDESKPFIAVQLNKMSLVNMNNKYYFLPRVSDNGLPGGDNFKVCGAEKPWFSNASGTPLSQDGNYLIDPNYSAKSSILTTGFSNYFNYPFFNNDKTIDNANVSNGNDRWGTIYIPDLLAGTLKDNWTPAGGTAGSYNVWRYVTENVIPAPISNQTNGISTGVVFKAKMIGDASILDNEDIKADAQKLASLTKLINTINNKNGVIENINDAPTIYVFDGNMYLGWDEVTAAAIDAAFSYTQGTDFQIIPDWNRSNSLYKAVFGTGGTGMTITLKDEDGNPIKDKDGKEISYTDPLKEDGTCANELYKNWMQHLNDESTTSVNPRKDFKTKVTDNGFTLYQASYDDRDGYGYYCYYYYWNRHNDNGQPGIMGPMEFAVVRNNVYKLSVTKVKQLGHPRLSENDPKKPTPETKDENESVYFDVDSEVIPWVVRLNNIEF